MKTLYLFIACLCTSLGFAQKTPQELAAKFLKTATENDVESYKKMFPNAENLSLYIKGVDPKATFPDGFFKTAYLKGLNDAVAGFYGFQKSAAQLKINLKEAVITKIETKANDIDMTEGGEVSGVAKTTDIDVHFKSDGNNYVLTIPSTIAIKDTWYVSGEPLGVAAEK